jgi:hypothetical protein
MSQGKGMSASRMNTKRPSKPRIAVNSKAGWQKRLDRFAKRYGRKLDTEEINRLLRERFVG